jgi:hypothetical protein
MKILCSRSNLLAGALAFAGMLAFNFLRLRNTAEDALQV